MELTEQQFYVLAALMRSHGVSREACHRVLVCGRRICDVARELDIAPNAISVALKNYRDNADRVDAAFNLRRQRQ